MNVSQHRSRLHGKTRLRPRQSYTATAVNVPVVGEVPTAAAVGGGALLLVLLFVVIGGEGDAPNVTIN